MKTECIRLTDTHTGDICLRIRHQSGLEIRIMEMPGFSTSYAQFGVKFGSVHTCFRQSDCETVTSVPDGTAHYLEHKLFENGEHADALKDFSRLGAADNAYTDWDRTVYHFHTQRNFGAALAVLLDFVRKPFFTQDSIDRERPIIVQEICECEDDPADQVFLQMLKGLYHQHGIRMNVLGTAESIAAITPDTLYQCHRAFYRLQNMVLCCAGNVSAQEILEIADRLLLPEPPAQTLLCPPQEPETVASAFLSRSMPVGKTMFCIGFKSSPVPETEQMRESILALMAADLLAGEVSPLHRRLLTEGLINDTFCTDCCIGSDWFTVYAEGESDDPQAVRDALLAEIEHMKQTGPDHERFEALRRAAYGDAVLSMNDPGKACDILLESYMAGGSSPFARTDILASLRPEDVSECLQKRFCADQICLSVITPDEQS